MYLKGVDNPEVVIGLVAPLGAPIDNIVAILKKRLETVGYETIEVRLSSFLGAYDSLPTPHPQQSAPAVERWNSLMSRGDELRDKLKRGDALAMHAAAAIASHRPARSGGGSRALEKKAFVLRQLKHPDEVLLLRQIYGPAFHLIGVYTDETVRSEYLRNVKMLSEANAHQLIERDAGEEIKHGQQVRKTFYLADCFIEAPGWDDDSIASTTTQLERYIDLLFGRVIATPTLDEYGMFLAHGAALRSADLSRQVGAAVLTARGEVLGLGANEVPAAGGGQYWGGDGDDRDFIRGYDSNEKIKLECLEEVLEHLHPTWESLQPSEKEEHVADIAAKLSGTRLMNLTEFGRAVHAEMEAILAAARVGVSTRGQILYTTTFPCHNCAKHIVGAGLTRAVYIEPYAKSLADRLHGDSIAFSFTDEEDKVAFEPFLGVAPRMYSALFSTMDPEGRRLRRKEEGGNLRTDPVGLKTFATPLTHIDREAIAAAYLDQVVEGLSQVSSEEEK